MKHQPITKLDETEYRTVHCPDCGGSGRWYSQYSSAGLECMTCGGSGEVTEEVGIPLTEVHGDPFFNRKDLAA